LPVKEDDQQAPFNRKRQTIREIRGKDFKKNPSEKGSHVKKSEFGECGGEKAKNLARLGEQKAARERASCLESRGYAYKGSQKLNPVRGLAGTPLDQVRRPAQKIASLLVKSRKRETRRFR